MLDFAVLTTTGHIPDFMGKRVIITQPYKRIKEPINSYWDPQANITEILDRSWADPGETSMYMMGPAVLMGFITKPEEFGLPINTGGK